MARATRSQLTPAPEKKTPGARPGGTRKPTCGPVETKVRQDIGALVTEHPMGEALAEMSFALARGIDSGPEMMAAALNRELRANLTELAGMGVGDDDDLGADLSAPVWDPPES